MTYNEKKSLYESIIKDVAKIVKRQINEMSPEVYRKAADKRQAQLDALPSYLKRKISKHNLNAPDDLRAHANNIESINLEVDNIEDITIEMFYNSKLNKSFHSLNDAFILYKPVTNEIGCDVNIRLFNSGENKTVSIWAYSFGELLESFYVVFKASYEEGIFSITTNRVIEVFKREWYRKLSNDDETTILDTVEVLKSKYDNNPPKTVKDVIKSINSVRDIKQEVLDAIEVVDNDDDYFDNDYRNPLFI